MEKSYDKHLNVFWSYGGKPYLEDNITRAFIITLSFLPKEKQLKFINFFINKNYEFSDEIEITFDLQNPYILKDDIQKAEEKYLIGLNPTGEVWGEKILNDILNLNLHRTSKEELEGENYKKCIHNLLIGKEEWKLLNTINNGIDKLRDLFLSDLRKGEARLDGWIFLFVNKRLKIVIGIETKLWNLDPLQLKNHCNKILGISSPTNEIIYKNFNETFDFLKNLSYENIVIHFLEYIERLGYYLQFDKFYNYDFNFAFINDDYSILNKKFSNFINRYFNSNNYKELREKYKLSYDKNKRRVFINKIGEKGLGNIYFDTSFDLKKEFCFFIGTEIGVAQVWSNQKFSEKLKDNKFRKLLNQFYPKEQLKNKSIYSTFEICFRINQCSYSDFIYLTEDENLDIILNKKLEFKYQNNLSKKKCVEMIKKISNFDEKTSSNYLKEKIYKLEKRGGNNTTAKNYNILSYLRNIDFIKQDYILESNEEDFQLKFHKILNKHIEGLNEIYNFIMYND